MSKESHISCARCLHFHCESHTDPCHSCVNCDLFLSEVATMQEDIDRLKAELVAAREQIDGLKERMVERIAENAKLRATIEEAKRESRGWTTGGYPEPFMRLAARLYHALDAGRGEGV